MRFGKLMEIRPSTYVAYEKFVEKRLKLEGSGARAFFHRAFHPFLESLFEDKYAVLRMYRTAADHYGRNEKLQARVVALHENAQEFDTVAIYKERWARCATKRIEFAHRLNLACEAYRKAGNNRKAGELKAEVGKTLDVLLRPNEIDNRTRKELLKFAARVYSELLRFKDAAKAYEEIADAEYRTDMKASYLLQQAHCMTLMIHANQSYKDRKEQVENIVILCSKAFKENIIKMEKEVPRENLERAGAKFIAEAMKKIGTSITPNTLSKLLSGEMQFSQAVEEQA